MATVATHAAVHVHGMVEVSVVRQSVDLDPRDRLSVLPAFADRCQPRAVGKDLTLTMAVDAGLGGRQVGVGGHLHKAVTVTTVHPQLFDMQGMGERNRLIGLVADAGILGGEIIPDPERDGCTDDKSAHKQL